MAWMVYLIVVTARTVVKAYDPYDILGVSRVSYTSRRVLAQHAQRISNRLTWKTERG
jgi:translocation protein SEC63